MSRRGRWRSPISLFSFQDIITSVSGIMILLTLLLALELITRKSAPGPQSSAELPASLEAAIAQAQEERDSLKAVSARTADVLTATVGTLPSVLRREITDAQAQSERLRREIAALTSQLTDAHAREAQAKDELADAEAKRARLVVLQREVRALQSQIERDRRQDRLFFEFSRGTDKSGWLVEVTGGRLAAAPLGRAARPNVFEGWRASSAFMDWARVSDRAASYFLFVIRPSGVPNFDAIEEDVRKAGFEFGYDLIGEDQTILDPDSGVLR